MGCRAVTSWQPLIVYHTAAAVIRQPYNIQTKSRLDTGAAFHINEMNRSFLDINLAHGGDVVSLNA